MLEKKAESTRYKQLVNMHEVNLTDFCDLNDYKDSKLNSGESADKRGFRRDCWANLVNRLLNSAHRRYNKLAEKVSFQMFCEMLPTFSADDIDALYAVVSTDNVVKKSGFENLTTVINKVADARGKAYRFCDGDELAMNKFFNEFIEAQANENGANVRLSLAIAEAPAKQKRTRKAKPKAKAMVANA